MQLIPSPFMGEEVAVFINDETCYYSTDEKVGPDCD